MASQGPNSAGTGANQSPGPGNDALGAWTTPGNLVSSNDSYAQSGSSGSSHIDLGAKLVIGGSITGDNKAVGTDIPSADTYLSYGSSSDLWGTTPTAAQVNGSDFGLAFAVTSTGGSGSNWLLATNFGFTIPDGSTIDGIIAEVECKDPDNQTNVDHVRITVHYTEGGGGFIPFPRPRGMRAGMSVLSGGM